MEEIKTFDTGKPVKLTKPKKGKAKGLPVITTGKNTTYKQYVKNVPPLRMYSFHVFRSFDLFEKQYEVARIRIKLPSDFKVQMKYKSRIHAFFKDLYATEISVEFKDAEPPYISKIG